MMINTDITAVKMDRKRITYSILLASDGLWKIFNPNIVLKTLNQYRYDKAGIKDIDRKGGN